MAALETVCAPAAVTTLPTRPATCLCMALTQERARAEAAAQRSAAQRPARALAGGDRARLACGARRGRERASAALGQHRADRCARRGRVPPPGRLARAAVPSVLRVSPAAPGVSHECCWRRGLRGHAWRSHIQASGQIACAVVLLVPRVSQAAAALRSVHRCAVGAGLQVKPLLLRNWSASLAAAPRATMSAASVLLLAQRTLGLACKRRARRCVSVDMREAMLPITAMCDGCLICVNIGIGCPAVSATS